MLARFAASRGRWTRALGAAYSDARSHPQPQSPIFERFFKWIEDYPQLN